MFRRSTGPLVVCLGMAVTACGSTTETTAVAEVGPTTTESTTSAPSTTTTTSELTTTVAVSDEPVLFEVGQPLFAGVTYQTTTDVPFFFSVPESNGSWMAVVQNQWSATVTFGNSSMTSQVGSEPGFAMAVAEEGATPESVADSITQSRVDTINYARSEGLFQGRDAIILDGTYIATEILGPVPVLTGEESFFSVLFHEERTYASQIFEEEGRVFIVSYDCHPDDVALVLAEIAPVLKSLEIGVDA
jgi:hypothetical protein